MKTSGVGANHFPILGFVALRAMWLELCSLASSIASLRRNNWFHHEVSLDHFAEQECVPYPLQCKYRRVRIRGIQKALSIRPAATLVDFHILVSPIDLQSFLEGQDRATETTLQGPP